MPSSMTSSSSTVPLLPIPVAIMTGFSVIFSFTTFVVSLVNLVDTKSTALASSPWFNVIIAVVTLLFHGILLLTVFLRRRQGTSYTLPLSEKALSKEHGETEERSLFTTTPILVLLVIILAVWIVAFGASLYELVLTKSSSSLDKGSVSTVALEMLAIASLAVYALFGKRHTGGSLAGSVSRGIKRFTVHALPISTPQRPLILPTNLSKTISKDSISKPSSAPEFLPSKLAPVAMFGVSSPPASEYASSPPATPPSPPKPALQSEPRFNGMKTLVLVDPRMDLASSTSFHGTKVVFPPNKF